MLTFVAPDLWLLPGEIRLPGGVRMPRHMGVVRLPSGGLFLHSPNACTDAAAAAVAALGQVQALIAPSTLHHLSIGDWKARFPEARIYAAAGVAKKRPELAIDAELGDQAPPAWQGLLDQIPIRGAPGLAETVFLHRPSRSLMVADLVFNVVKPATFTTALLLTLTGTRGRLASSRAWRFATKDRAAFKRSLEAVIELTPQRLLPCHGDPVVGPDLPQRLRDAFAWGLR